jgi:hypothetical protein
MLRKLLYAVSGIGLIVAVGFATMLFAAWSGGNSFDAEAGPYVEESVKFIGSRWEADQLMTRLAPDAREKLTRKEIENLFRTVEAGIGPILSTEPPQLGHWTSTATFSGTRIVAQYVVPARFERGSGKLHVRAVRTGGQWAVCGFFVDSNELLERLRKNSHPTK